MSRNNKLLIGFLIIVLVPVITVWVVAWPILRPVTFPQCVAGEVVQGEAHYTLTNEQVQSVNVWLSAHRTAWGVEGEKPPGTANSIFIMKDRQGASFIVSVWHFRHSSDVVGIQKSLGGTYRMRSLDHEASKAPLLPHIP